MSRVQLALNVTDLEKAVTFYSTLFQTAPAKRHEGYANFAIADPPLKLVLMESSEGATLNHLGIEVESSQGVGDAGARLAAEGLAVRTEDEVECCYARQDKVWVADPDGAPCEVYTVLRHLGTFGGGEASPASSSECCGSGSCCSNG